MGTIKVNVGAKRHMGCHYGKWVWGARRQMGRQKANGFGNEPMAMKPNETAMNPWHEAEIKGNEPMAISQMKRQMTHGMKPNEMAKNPWQLAK